MCIWFMPRLLRACPAPLDTACLRACSQVSGRAGTAPRPFTPAPGSRQAARGSRQARRGGRCRRRTRTRTRRRHMRGGGDTHARARARMSRRRGCEVAAMRARAVTGRHGPCRRCLGRHGDARAPAYTCTCARSHTTHTRARTHTHTHTPWLRLRQLPSVLTAC